MGPLEVPADAYYGIHTLRAYQNFKISGIKVHPELIRSLALVKKACAITNVRTGHLDEKIGEAIIAACDEIAAGALEDQFITDAFQGGAGTSMNMNLNEIIANRAIEILGGNKGDYHKVHLLEHSFGLVTALSPYIGYEEASSLAREAQTTGKSIRQLALEKNLFTDQELEAILSPTEMTHPGIAGLHTLETKVWNNET